MAMTEQTKPSSSMWRSPDGVAGTGNRLALIGTVLYFLEWVAIIGAGGISVLLQPGSGVDKIFHGYAGHSDAFAWASGWFGVVLLGRVLFAVGVRRALRATDQSDAFAEFGVLAMLAGVVFETAAYGVVMGAGIVADHGGSRSTVAALDAVGLSLDNLVWGATGLAILALAWVMFRSGTFPKVLGGVGVVAGVILVVDGLAFNAPQFFDLHEGLTNAALLLWIWMIWSSILIWMRTPRASVTSATA
jgi:hypothetical protein